MMQNSIRILHLSDLHFDPGKPRDSSIVISALFDFIHAIPADEKLDFVIFSGDLVQSGSSLHAFEKSIEIFVNPLIKAAAVSSDRLIICPGNHDIDRDLVRSEQWVENGLLTTLKDRNAINDFIDRYSQVSLSATATAPDPIRRLQHFYQSIWDIKNSSCIFSSPFLKIYLFDVAETKTDVASFNTGWRATGEPNDLDRGRLILGESTVDKALEKIASANVRLAVFHHPIEWCTENDRVAIEARLQSEFDIMFCGHIHRSSPEFRTTMAGEAICSQTGCLYKSRDFFNGFNVVRISLDQACINFDLYEYSDQRRKFVRANRLVDNGNINFPFPKR